MKNLQASKQKRSLAILASVMLLMLSMVSVTTSFSQQQANAQTSPTTTLTIASKYADGANLTGMWNTISPAAVSGGANGFTAKTYTVNANSTTAYNISVGNYQDIKFHHWLDTNSTTVTRAVSNIAQPTTLTAIYTSNAHPLPQPGGGGGGNPQPITSSALTITSVTDTGTSISGVYTVIKDAAGNVLAAKNTPFTFTVPAGSGQTYSITPSDYEILQSGSYKYVKWTDNTTGRIKTIVPTNATMSFGVVFHNNPLGIKSISANAVYMVDNSTLTGAYFDITPRPRANIAAGYTPISWTLEADTTYTVTPQDYGSYVFAHWQDGSTTRARQVQPTTGLALVAYYGTNTDQTAPTVTIIAPQFNATRTSSQVTISGLASDNVGIQKVEVDVDGAGNWQKADGLQNWSYMAEHLTNGTHYATVRVTDFAGNKVTLQTPGNFTVAINPVIPKTGVYIPLYFKPVGNGLTQYQGIAAAKMAHPDVPIVAAINMAGGPGTAVDADELAGAHLLQSAGVTVIGYTPTLYGMRNIDLVKADMLKWKQWYNVDGIMLDEFANSAGFEAQYANLTAYAHDDLGLKIVIGNAGADPPQSYVGKVNVIGITEGDGYPPLAWIHYCVTCLPDGTGGPAGGWHHLYDKNNFRFSRYAIDSLDPNFVHEASKWVGLFYLTNGISPERWNTLPPYFGDLITLLDH